MKRQFYGFMFYNEKLPIVFFILIIFAFRSVYSSDLQHKHSDFILCRLCGHNIAPATHVINIQSPAAEKIYNRSLFGLDNVEVQRIRNPLGIEFNIVLSTGGTCVGRRERWKSHNSWFPGYLWKPCFCSNCSHHIGWIFEPINSAHEERAYASTKGFYALILDNIISEDYSDSLLATPKISTRDEL